MWDADDVKLDGGVGTDTLSMIFSAAVDLTAVDDAKTADIEVIDLEQTNLLGLPEINILTLATSDVLAISSTTDTLRIEGGFSDIVTVTDGVWSLTVDGNYKVYTLGTATLRINADIQTINIDM